MLHFLPQTNRHLAIGEYLLRFSIFFLFFGFLALLLLVALFLPSYFFAEYKDRTETNQLSFIDTSATNKSQDPIQLIKKINSTVAVLTAGGTRTLSTSDLVQKIMNLKNDGISIASASVLYQNGTAAVTIGGTAQTRDELTAFYTALKNAGAFTNVTLPVSDLIPETDASFSITLGYHDPTAK